MAGWIRRNWIPTAGMAVAVAFVAWLAWINVRGSGSGSAGPTPSARVSGSPSASASASASADPAQAQVEAAAKRWVQAYYDSYRTADASTLNALAVPDTQAAGEAGVPREAVLHSHKAMLVSQLTFDQINVDVTTPSATVDMSYTTLAAPADWPALTPTGPAVEKHWTAHIELELTSGQWLIVKFA